MSGDTSVRPSLPPSTGRLGVLEATGMGWRLLMSDFWRLWVVGLVFTAILMGAQMFGMVSAIVVLPPMLAGLFYAVGRRIDGAPAEVGNLFAGFKDRFGQSVVGWLPVTLGACAFGMLLTAVALVLVFVGLGLGAAVEHEDEAVAAVVIGCILVFVMAEMLLILLLMVYTVFFRFVPAAVWDHPESGWEAAKASARLVWDHVLAMVGLLVLFALISMAAQMLGMMACCVGVLFTGPAVTVWYVATMVYLYRAWTGRPLVQPVPPPAPVPAPGA